jgi:hypothetical protein
MLLRIAGWSWWWVACACGSQSGYGYCVASSRWVRSRGLPAPSGMPDAEGVGRRPCRAVYSRDCRARALWSRAGSFAPTFCEVDVRGGLVRDSATENRVLFPRNRHLSRLSRALSDRFEPPGADSHVLGASTGGSMEDHTIPGAQRDLVAPVESSRLVWPTCLPRDTGQSGRGQAKRADTLLGSRPSYANPIARRL